MFDLIGAVSNGTFNIKNYFIGLAVALVCGLIVAFAASRRNKISASFCASLILLPAIVATVVIMVSGNIGTGIAVAGAFSLIRFRSVPGRASDITFIFLSMTAGITCAAGYLGVAVLFSVLVSAVAIALAYLKPVHKNELELKITVPENLAYVSAFDEVFKEYTTATKLIKVRTINMGSLYKLDYIITVKDKNKSREFIDALRCINGNLEINLSEAAERTEEL